MLPLSTYPPFSLPDTRGMVDLVRTPDDTSFWDHLKRLKILFGTNEGTKICVSSVFNI